MARSPLIAGLLKVTFLDAMDVASLPWAKQQIEQAGNRLVITTPSQPVMRVFEVLRLSGLFDDAPLS